MKCPVCLQAVETKNKDYIGGTLCEETIECKCGYRYDYAYGHTQEHFGPFEYRGDYAGGTENDTIIPKTIAFRLWRIWLQIISLFSYANTPLHK